MKQNYDYFHLESTSYFLGVSQDEFSSHGSRSLQCFAMLFTLVRFKLV